MSGVLAVVLLHGQLLLEQRACAPFKGYWALPGGATHDGESCEDAVIREVQEEVGLDITIVRPLKCNFPNEDVTAFLAEAQTFNIIVQADEVSSTLLVDAHALIKMQPLMVPSHYRCLMKVLEHEKNLLY